MRKRLSKAERKTRLKATAIDLIAQKGYTNTTVQDIVDKAEFSKGGFYNCYASKEELFADILDDSMAPRYEQLTNYKKNPDMMDKKEFMIESLLDKLLDNNKYKAMYSTLMIEKSSNKALALMYEKYERYLLEAFVDYCKREGFEEYIKLVNDEFSTFISSIILGMNVFKNFDEVKYRMMMRDILVAYFENINLFKN